MGVNVASSSLHPRVSKSHKHMDLLGQGITSTLAWCDLLEPGWQSSPVLDFKDIFVFTSNSSVSFTTSFTKLHPKDAGTNLPDVCLVHHTKDWASFCNVHHQSPSCTWARSWGESPSKFASSSPTLLLS